MNEFIQGNVDMQDSSKYFHYSQMPLLVTMVLCKLPSKCDYEPQDVDSFPSMRFSTMNYMVNKKKQNEINSSFQLWIDLVIKVMNHSYHMMQKVLDRYNKFLFFQGDHHNVFMSLHMDLEFQPETFPICITEEGVKDTIKDQLEHLCTNATMS